MEVLFTQSNPARISLNVLSNLPSAYPNSFADSGPLLGCLHDRTNWKQGEGGVFQALGPG